ncbi:hypothetical protein PIIN_08422 [Serendipita indica DSM 11827]|uniref:F-box domain-containing protein n=1 Tax=Serendipita indica (strain DSM 11827) TaxID=1109443 RepID=G4TT26_SERID|nr:hypothetical protein PIIN_08422 [Serendipita indica DSM 11827]
MPILLQGFTSDETTLSRPLRLNGFDEEDAPGWVRWHTEDARVIQATSNSVTSLPFEIWVEILFYVGLTALDPYDMDNLDTLPVQLRLTDWRTGNPQLQNWKDLRCVCRMWYRILETWTRTMLVFDGNKPVLKPHNQLVSRVHIEGNDAAILEFTTFQRPADVFRQITTLSFAFPSLEPSGVTKILLLGRSLPNIRNLSLDTLCKVQDLWTRLETGFPHLLVLRLSHIKCESGGTFRLNHLQLFILHSYIHNPPAFSFPSLRHLWAKTYCHNTQLERDHRQQLISGLGLSYYHLAHHIDGPNFWEAFPNVRLIATKPGSLKEIMTSARCLGSGRSFPSRGHPIVHLTLILDPTPWSNPSDTMRTLCEILDQWPLQRLSIDKQGLTPWEIFWIKKKCMARGVAWTPLPPKSCKEHYSTAFNVGMIVIRWFMSLRPVHYGLSKLASLVLPSTLWPQHPSEAGRLTRLKLRLHQLFR